MDLSELNLTDDQAAAVQKYVQSETDKVRTDYSTRLRAVAAELNQYKPQEKTDAEKELEQRIKELEIRENIAAAKEKTMLVGEKLKESGIPAELAEFLTIGDNVDEDVAKVRAALGTMLFSNLNKPGNHPTNKGITKDDFAKMGYAERARLYQDNPQLYQALTK